VWLVVGLENTLAGEKVRFQWMLFVAEGF